MIPKRRACSFAFPGDLETRTGGYIYDKRLIGELRELDWSVDAVQLGDGFPHPSEETLEAAIQLLSAIPAGRPTIIDGLAFGALPTHGLSEVKAPILALVHHPLAMETGLAAGEAASFRINERANLAHARRVAVTSHTTARVLMSEYDVRPNRVVEAPPGVDRPTRARIKDRSGPKRILSVGSLTHRKGHDVLLQALARISDLDWRADIVGEARDPAVADALKRQADRLDLSDRVQFIGVADQQKLDELYARSDLFALATRYEGYGMVFAEAMVWGLPIVGCDAGAVGRTVPKSAGRLVRPDDPEAFASSLRDLLTKDAFYAHMQAGAEAAALELPTWRQTGEAIEGALLDILNAEGA